MSTQVAASSQLFYYLATLVIMTARPRLTEDKLDEIADVFSEHTEGFSAEMTRYGTKETKNKNKLVVLLIYHENMMTGSEKKKTSKSV